MASTTEEDTPHDGAPTSWSSEIDQLTAGVSGLKKIQRLMLISAGNTNQNLFGNDDYLSAAMIPKTKLIRQRTPGTPFALRLYRKECLAEGRTGSAPCSRR